MAEEKKGDMEELEKLNPQYITAAKHWHNFSLMREDPMFHYIERSKKRQKEERVRELQHLLNESSSSSSSSSSESSSSENESSSSEDKRARSKKRTQKKTKKKKKRSTHHKSDKLGPAKDKPGKQRNKSVEKYSDDVDDDNYPKKKKYGDKSASSKKERKRTEAGYHKMRKKDNNHSELDRHRGSRDNGRALDECIDESVDSAKHKRKDKRKPRNSEDSSNSSKHTYKNKRKKSKSRDSLDKDSDSYNIKKRRHSASDDSRKKSKHKKKKRAKKEEVWTEKAYLPNVNPPHGVQHLECPKELRIEADTEKQSEFSSFSIQIQNPFSSQSCTRDTEEQSKQRTEADIEKFLSEMKRSVFS